MYCWPQHQCFIIRHRIKNDNIINNLMKNVITGFRNVVPPLRFACCVRFAVNGLEIDDQFKSFIEEVKTRSSPSGQVDGYRNNSGRQVSKQIFIPYRPTMSFSGTELH